MADENRPRARYGEAFWRTHHERLDDGQLQFGFEDIEADLARAEARLPSSAGKTPRTRSQVDRPSLPAHLPRQDIRLNIEH